MRHWQVEEEKEEDEEKSKIVWGHPVRDEWHAKEEEALFQRSANRIGVQTSHFVFVICDSNLNFYVVS